MTRAFSQWITNTVLFALLAMSFLISVSAHCASSNRSVIAQGSFCSVEHTSTPLHSEKSEPEIALVNELGALMLATIALQPYAKLIFEKFLLRFMGIVGRIHRNKHVRSRSGPIPFDIFLPQIASTHGM